MTPSRLVRIGAAIGAACAFGAQAAPVYHLVDLGLNHSAHDVNAQGAVAGTFNAVRGEIWRDGAWRQKASGTFVSELDDLGNVAGWRWDDVGSTAMWWPHDGGGPVDLPPPFPSIATEASAISAGGTIAGVAADSRGTYHCVRWQGGVAEDLAIGGSSCHIAGVNVRGAIAGTVRRRDGTDQAFIWQDGSKRALASLGGPGSVAASINDQGHVVGTAQFWITEHRINEHAVLWNRHGVVDLGTLDGVFGHSHAYGVNNAGDVVGDSIAADGYAHGFLYTGGQMLDLGSLIENGEGWFVSNPQDISDDGVIVGTTGADGGRFRAYMLVPVTR
jgi:probable HAF family extracellular repeat protein